MLNFMPKDSTENALAFQLYSLRLSERFSVPEEEIEAALPIGSQKWRYPGASPATADDYRGFEGHFRSSADIDKLYSLLAKGEDPQACSTTVC